MTGYLVDTNVISEFVKLVPHEDVTRWFRQVDPFFLFASVVTIGEIRLGAENMPLGKRRMELEDWLEGGLPAWFAANLLPITREVADRWGRLTIRDKRNGRMLSTMDGL